jgi:NTE family protein
MTGLIVPDDLAHYGIDPDGFSVAQALRISAAVPFLFRPVTLRAPATGERVLFADGAMASNYPIEAATEDRPILGFRLFEDAAEHPHVAIRGPASLARSVVISGIRARYGLPSTPREREAILRIPVSANLDFSLSPAEAGEVFRRGKRAAAEQLDDLEIVQTPTMTPDSSDPDG